MVESCGAPAISAVTSRGHRREPRAANPRTPRPSARGAREVLRARGELEGLYKCAPLEVLSRPRENRRPQNRNASGGGVEGLGEPPRASLLPAPRGPRRRPAPPIARVPPRCGRGRGRGLAALRGGGRRRAGRLLRASLLLRASRVLRRRRRRRRRRRPAARRLPRDAAGLGEDLRDDRGHLARIELGPPRVVGLRGSRMNWYVLCHCSWRCC